MLPTLSALETQCKQLRLEIEQATQKAQRKAQSVQLLAVSKQQPLATIRQLFHLGQQAFGENYLKEALPKIQALTHYPIEWHFLGRLQRNKCKLIATHFHMVHSVCTFEQAQALAAHRAPLLSSLGPLNLLLQVNISLETSKNGCLLEAVPELAASISQLEGIQLRGLMALPAPTFDFQEQCQAYQPLSALFQQLQHAGFEFDILSIGTSSDFKAAITQGATLIRLGTALFGPRSSLTV